MTLEHLCTLVRLRIRFLSYFGQPAYFHDSAAETGHLECVKLLIDYGARLNCIDKFGSTPLRGAISGGHQEVSAYLKSKGASLFMESFEGMSGPGSRSFTDHELEHLRVIFNSFGTGFVFFLLWGVASEEYKRYVQFADKTKPETSHVLSGEALRSWLKISVGFQLKKHKVAQAELSALVGDENDEGVSWRRFLSTMRRPTLLTRAFRDELAVPRWTSFQSAMRDLFNYVQRTVPSTAGSKPVGVPELERVDSNTFGCAVCTVDGQILTLGSEEDFSLQASVFPFLYSQLVEKVGYEEFHRHIGKEPSGSHYNSISLNSEGKPHNALVNTGAIVMCQLYEPERPQSERFKDLLQFASDMANSKLGFSQTVYLSEKERGLHNYAMAHYIASKGALSSRKTDIQNAMDFFFQLCSIEANCEKLACMAATLANDGIAPMTGRRILSETTVKQTTALIHSCGMYIASGEWACNVGLPAKSGISGCIWLIVPGVCGIAIYAPPVDHNGTSVRGAALAQAIANRFSWNLFDVLHSAQSS